MTGRELLNMRVSYYGNVSYTTSRYTVKIKDWISKYSIKNKSNIIKIRQEYDKDEEKAKKMKSDLLPCVTMTGVFDTYRRIDLAKSINPIIAIDIDYKDNQNIEDWDKTKHDISNLPYVFLTSLSCSGRGLYALIYFDNTLDIKKVFNSIKRDFKDMGIEIDKNCKDVTRLRFISYDDNMLIRLGEVQQYDKELEIAPDVSSLHSVALEEPDMFIYTSIYHLITKCNYRADDYYEWLQDGFRLSTFGDLGYLLFMLLSMKSKNYDAQKAKEKFYECKRTTRYNRDSLVYYFHKLKEYYGKSWKDIVNNS